LDVVLLFGEDDVRPAVADPVGQGDLFLYAAVAVGAPVEGHDVSL